MSNLTGSSVTVEGLLPVDPPTSLTVREKNHGRGPKRNPSYDEGIICVERFDSEFSESKGTHSVPTPRVDSGCQRGRTLRVETDRILFCFVLLFFSVLNGVLLRGTFMMYEKEDKGPKQEGGKG